MTSYINGPCRTYVAGDGSRRRMGDQPGQAWTVIPDPEKRKVGDSTPPLTASHDQQKRPGGYLRRGRLTAVSPAAAQMRASRRHAR